MEKTTKQRIFLLDELRGFAVICMVLHHCFYDIGYLLGLDWGYEVFDFLCYFQPIFWVIFIVTSGICTNLSRNSTKRGLILLSISLVITGVTAVIMPALGFEGEEIYFGVIHCLACCMIIAGLLKKVTSKIPTAVGMIGSLALFAITYNLQFGKIGIGSLSLTLPEFLSEVNFLFPLGITGSSFESADYFPLMPWFFIFAFGIFSGIVMTKKGFPEYAYRSRSKVLQVVGKNSLWVYVFHQVALYAIFFIIRLIFNIT